MDIKAEIEELLENTIPCDKGIKYDMGWGTVQIYYEKKKDRIRLVIIQRSPEELEELEMPSGPWSTDISIRSLPFLIFLGIIEE